MLKRHKDWELNGEVFEGCTTNLSVPEWQMKVIQKLLREQIRLLRKIAGEEE